MLSIISITLTLIKQHLLVCTQLVYKLAFAMNTISYYMLWFSGSKYTECKTLQPLSCHDRTYEYIWCYVAFHQIMLHSVFSYHIVLSCSLFYSEAYHVDSKPTYYYQSTSDLHQHRPSVHITKLKCLNLNKGHFGGIPLLNHHLRWPRLRSPSFAQICCGSCENCCCCSRAVPD